MNDDLEALLQEALEESRKRQWRRDNPYVGDLIEVLRPHKDGLHRRQIVMALERMRTSKGLPIPEAFDKTVQSSLQRHASSYAAFKTYNSSAKDDVFYPPRGKGSGYWAVHLGRAAAWLVAKNKQERQEDR